MHCTVIDSSSEKLNAVTANRAATRLGLTRSGSAPPSKLRAAPLPYRRGRQVADHAQSLAWKVAEEWRDQGAATWNISGATRREGGAQPPIARARPYPDGMRDEGLRARVGNAGMAQAQAVTHHGDSATAVERYEVGNRRRNVLPRPGQHVGIEAS